MKSYPLIQTSLLLLLLCSSFQAESAAILISDGRSIEANAFIGSTSGGSSNTPQQIDGAFTDFSDFAGVLFDLDPSIPVGVVAQGVGNQTSTVTTTSFIGSLSASAFMSDPNNLLSEFDAANGESFYIIGFDLLAAHSYTLTGNLFANATGTAGQVATLTLGDISLSNLDSPFSISGILQAGSYQLSVSSAVFAGANESGNTSADFNLQISEVPLPAAVWLFGFGLITLLSFCKRNGKHNFYR